LMCIASIRGVYWSTIPSHLLTLCQKNHRLTRWGLMLQEYILIIKHIKCKDNCTANALSRVG
jgi:hypothetical protein